MARQSEIDLRAAINAISDVIHNRPRPIREFDQIYMKAADMVIQSEIIADWADGKRVAFIGDGDAISVCIAYLKKRDILQYGPSHIKVFDFDERICNSIIRFADKERMSETLEAIPYNCFDAFPDVGGFDCYYTNPPWGQHNEGESVKLFAQRGMEAVGHKGEGVIVIADDDDLDWPKVVLKAVQNQALEEGFFIQRMMRKLHLYHLEEEPDLHSCNLFVKATPGNKAKRPSQTIDDPDLLDKFYGRNGSLHVRYVRQKKRVDYGKAHDDEYALEYLEADK